MDGRDMSPIRDPEMKLFGAMIPLPATQIVAESQHKSDPIPAPASPDQKDVCGEETHNPREVSVPGVKEEPARPNSSFGVKSGKGEYQASIEDNRSAVDPNHEEKQMETSATRGEQKVLKKMEKILSCPRCNSMDTKFCYYNNYNVNQPRHFCKNCQRYWTAGGATRNVPVGAGRRKHKHSASHYRHIVMPSDGLPTAHVETPCGISGPIVPLNGIGTVIKFGPDMPPCEPMETILNVGDGKKNIDNKSFASGGNGDEPASGSTVKASTCLEDKLPKKAGLMEHGDKTVSCSGFPPAHHWQCYPGPPWTYPWSTWYNSVSAIVAGRCSSELIYEPENGDPSPVQWNSPPMVAAPAFCAPRIPFPFVPASYWGSMPGGSHSMPWSQSNCSMPQSSSGNNACSGNGSPTLGKHSRDATLEDKEKTDKCLWVPKTLRFDDPDEAAKSSIWATLGIKLDPNEPATQGCIFKAFQPNVEGKGHFLNAKQVLQANPAALARSRMFQESV